MSIAPKIIIHGGFYSELQTTLALKKAKQEALLQIVQMGYKELLKEGAFAAVVKTVTALEDDALFNAGLGSQLQSDGHIRMSAAIMDSLSNKFSGVLNVEKLKNPV